MLAPPRYRTITSVLTRPNDTTAYAQNDLIASSTTAGSIVVPHFAIPVDAQTEVIEVVRARLFTDLTSGFTTFQGHIDLFNGAAPTFSNGDNGAFAIATGMANWVGDLQTVTSSAYQAGGDGAALDCMQRAQNAGLTSFGDRPFHFGRTEGDKLYWALREIDATGFTPAANQTFTLALDIILRSAAAPRSLPL